MNKIFYRVLSGGPTGKVWDRELVEWVDDSVPVINVDEPWMGDIINDEPTIDTLIATLSYYNYPLGEVAPPAMKVAQFGEAIAARLDALAQEKQYDNMDKARLASLTEEYAEDGDYANHAYAITWIAAPALEDQILAGTLTVEAAIQQLPALAWPVPE